MHDAQALSVLIFCHEPPISETGCSIAAEAFGFFNSSNFCSAGATESIFWKCRKVERTPWTTRAFIHWYENLWSFNSFIDGPPASTIKFPHGALRITRTFGRSAGTNTISLEDIIDSSALTSAFVYSYNMGDLIFRYLPFKRLYGSDREVNYQKDTPVGQIRTIGFKYWTFCRSGLAVISIETH